MPDRREKQRILKDKLLNRALAQKLAACFAKDGENPGPCACMGLGCCNFACSVFWEILLKDNGLEKAVRLYDKASEIFI